MRYGVVLGWGAAVAVAGAGFAGTTNYVAPEGSDANTGTGWGDAWATISHAVANSVDTDLILVSNGTYDVTCEIRVDKELTIHGLDRDEVIVRRTGETACRIFAVSNAAARLANLTIRDGLVTNGLNGGGVYLAHGTLSNCHITGNATLECRNIGWGGGGVYMTNGLLQDCQITANVSRDWASAAEGNGQATVGDFGGGGVFMLRGTLSGCTIAWNTNTVSADTGAMSGGGGVQFRGGLITNCSIVFNRHELDGGAGWPGGGGVGAHGGPGTIVDSTISSNYASRRGGGMYLQGSNIRILRCRFIGNECPQSGNTGGAGLTLNSGGVMENCLIASNVGPYGISLSYCNSKMRNCTVIGHTIGIGDAYVYTNKARIENTIVAHNRDADFGLTVSSYKFEVTNICFNCCSTQFVQGVNHNVVALPGLKDAAGGDYTLRGDSPCVDAGTTDVWVSITTDLTGLPHQDHNGDGIAQPDIGCFELMPKPGSLMVVR